MSWCALEAVAREAPEQALRRWEEAKQAAREEVRNGHRAARALEGYGGPCGGRAQLLAVRAELAGPGGRATSRSSSSSTSWPSSRC